MKDVGLSPLAASRPRSFPPIPVIGNLPPPVTGLAAITEAAARALEAARPVRRTTLSPGAARGPLCHPVRALRTLGAASTLISTRLRGGRWAYLSCDGGWGRLYLLVLIALARALGIRMRLHHHSYAYLDRPDRLMRLLLRAGGGALAHVFLSEGMRARFRALHGAEAGAPDLVISNAVFLRLPAPKRPVPPADAPLTVGLLANLDAAKGLHEMTTLAAHLSRLGSPVRIALAGPVRDPEDRLRLEEALAALGPERLSWAGPVHGAAKAAFYASLDLFALPTRHADEAQPAVIWEAAFAGVPSLAWARGAIAEQISDADLLLEPGAPFAPWAAARIRRLAADRTRLAALSAAALERAEREAEAGRTALHALVAELAGAAA